MTTCPTYFERKEPCFICGGINFQFICDGYDRLHDIPGTFKLIKCTGCGLFLLHPTLSKGESAAYYPQEYICYLPAIEDETNCFTRINRYLALRKRVQWINRTTRVPGEILDIGCATGILLSGLKKRGWACQGVEPDKKASDYARKRFDINIHNGYLEDVNFSENSFDVITMMDVLEHVHDPVSTVVKVYKLLKPGGKFMGSLPNASSWERHIFRSHWAGWEVPRHYRTFNPENLPLFFKKYGFHDIKIMSFTGRHGAFMLSIKFWLKSIKKNDGLKKFITIILGSLPFRLLTFPFFLLSEVFNRSTIMMFIASKPEE